MNYLQQISIYTDLNGTEYKQIKTQMYSETLKNKTTNKFFIDNKQVRNHERFICEQMIDENQRSNRYNFTEKKWSN